MVEVRVRRLVWGERLTCPFNAPLFIAIVIEEMCFPNECDTCVSVKK